MHSRYGFQINEANRLGLTRGTFDFREWIEPSFLMPRCESFGLENFWAPRDENGQPRL